MSQIEEYLCVVEEIPAPIGEVWAVVAGFGTLRAWISSVESCALDGFGVGATRTVAALGGLTRERLTACDPASHRLAYELEDPTILPARGVQSEISLRALDQARTELTWTSRARSFDAPPAELAAFVEAFYREAIDGLRRLLSR